MTTLGTKTGKLAIPTYMKPSKKALDIIKKWESMRLNAYLDPIGIPTIGYGTIKYENGAKVKMGEKVTQKRADELLDFEAGKKAREINKLLKKELNQNQYDAILSFSYNVGTGALGKSTLLKKINVSPCDPTIKGEFMKWIYAGGQKFSGLENRRKEEAALYFS